MNNFNRKWAYLILILALVALAITIIQEISGRTPNYFGNDVIIQTIFNFDIIIFSLFVLSIPTTGAVGDERTKRAGSKASLYAFLILVVCLLLLGLVNSIWLATKDYRFMPFILAHIGIYSWAILTYYFVKNGEV
ncbi:MAG: DUF2178 domain-containing protein [Candidatus Methanoperedens sp.]|nr:DUF2178 domain-containing protein [Candidatus Methanoperedens sp.]